MRRVVRALRPFQTLASPTTHLPLPVLRLLSTSSSAAGASSDSDSAAPDADFNSADFSLPPSDPAPASAARAHNPVSALRKLRFDPSLRARADEALFGENSAGVRVQDPVEEERSREVALALLEAAMEPPDEDEEEPGEVREEDQMSLSVGIVGAPNAGKSSLTNTVVRVISALSLCVPRMFQ
jgi:hypothetical protein